MAPLAAAEGSMDEGKRLSMRQAREIFRLKFEAGLSNEQVARAWRV
jgi:hypothetical protein